MSKTISFDVDIKTAGALQKIDDLFTAYQNGAVEAGRKLEEALGGTVKKQLVWEARTVVEGGEEVKKMVPAYKEIYSEVNKIEAAQKKLTQTQTGSVTSLRQQVNEAKQARDNIAKMVTVTDQYGKSVQQVNPAWDLANQKVKALETSLATLTGNFFKIAQINFPGIDQLGKFAGVFGQVSQIVEGVTQAIQLLNQAFDPLVQRNKQLENLKLSLTAFTGSAETANDILGSAKNIALTYGVSLETVEKAYKRLTPAIVASGGTVADAEKAITALAARTVALGLNTEQAGRYQEAFAQVMGKGKLQSEELNQQFSELDGALRSQLAAYVEAQYGITDFNQALKDGSITAAIFREAFVAISSDLTTKLAGGVNEIQERIRTLGQEGGLTVQQLENLRNTLGTITAEGFGETFAGLGKSVEAVKTQFSQFFAALATNTPALSEGFGILFAIIGKLVEIIVGGLLVALAGTIIIIDRVVGVLQDLGKWIASNPIFKPIIDALAFIGNEWDTRFAKGFDIVMQLGESVDTTAIKIQDAGGRAAELSQKFAEGKITVDEYKDGVAKIKEEIDSNVQKANDAYENEKTKLAELKEEMNTRYDEESTRLEGLIAEKQEIIDAEKAKLQEVIDQIKEDYAQRYDLLDQEKTKVEERYATELAAIKELTPAQQEQLNLRKQKLEAIVNSAKATYEEKVNAQASLDTMRQQEQVAALRAEKEGKVNDITDARKKLQQDETTEIKNAQTAFENRVAAERQAIKEFKTALDENKQRQRDMNKLIDEQIGKQNDTSKAVKDTENRVKDQIVQVQIARNRYEEAKQKAEALKNQIDEAYKNQIKLNQEAAKFRYPPPPPKNAFMGGPVTAGEKYTVNEFGREAFLSASGKLTEIGARPWGTWRAPSSGTIIPADVYASLKAAAASRSAYKGVGPSAYGAGGSGLGSMLRGLTGGSQDRITNNVTIHTANPVQAASDILVQMTKLRRLRYS